MSISRLFSGTFIFAFLVFAPVASRAQTTDCEEGAGQLNNAQPKDLTPQQIIDKFSARETDFKQALNNYVYTQDITVQELDGLTVVGEFRLVQDITFVNKGNRFEDVKFAPQSSLHEV